MTSIVFCLFNMQWKASTLIQDLERDDIEGHLLEQLLKPIHALKKQSTLELWQVLTGAVLSKLPHPDGFGLGFSVAPCRVQG